MVAADNGTLYVDYAQLASHDGELAEAVAVSMNTSSLTANDESRHFLIRDSRTSAYKDGMASFQQLLVSLCRILLRKQSCMLSILCCCTALCLLWLTQIEYHRFDPFLRHAVRAVVTGKQCCEEATIDCGNSSNDNASSDRVLAWLAHSHMMHVDPYMIHT